jgi:alanine racemase
MRPPAGKRQEVSVRVGILLYGIDAVREAVTTELTKIFKTHSAM